MKQDDAGQKVRLTKIHKKKEEYSWADLAVLALVSLVETLLLSFS
jgi:hypothetical protein